MAIRYFWMISLNSKSLIYSHRFVTVEKRAEKMGLQMVRHLNNDEIVKSILIALAIVNEEKSDAHSDCTRPNQMPVIEITCANGVELWPIVVIELNGILFCGHSMVDNCKSRVLIDHKSIALSFSTLQHIANAFLLNDNKIAKLESIIASHFPFGAIINTNYAKIRDLTEQKMVQNSLHKVSSDYIRIIINEFISSAERNNEIVFGTIKIDVSKNNPSLNDGIIEMQINKLENLNLVLTPNCSVSDNIVYVKLKDSLSEVIRYKNDHETDRSLIFYDYYVQKDVKNQNIHKYQLTLSLRNASQYKFLHFTIQIKYRESEAIIKPINLGINHGQLYDKDNSILWIIGTKVPKTGIKLNFDIPKLSEKNYELETNCNFKVENHQFSVTNLNNENVKFIGNQSINKVPINIESTLSTHDYKLIPYYK